MTQTDFTDRWFVVSSKSRMRAILFYFEATLLFECIFEMYDKLFMTKSTWLMFFLLKRITDVGSGVFGICRIVYTQSLWNLFSHLYTIPFFSLIRAQTVLHCRIWAILSNFHLQWRHCKLSTMKFTDNVNAFGRTFRQHLRTNHASLLVRLSGMWLIAADNSALHAFRRGNTVAMLCSGHRSSQ